MFFPDMSPYRYSDSSERIINVGWLGAGHPIPEGKVEPIVRDQLVRLAREPANLMRGLHYCEFCLAESPLVATTRDEPDKPAYLGSGEIRVSDRHIIYAAPTLIVHYIDAHGYLPPSDFCDAVRLTVE